MSKSKIDYSQIKPSYEYLTDEFILSLAWKKTSSFLKKSLNYVDRLNLDITAMDVKSNIKQWSVDLDKGYIPKPLRLIPAPKSYEWKFNEDVKDDTDMSLWESVDEKEDGTKNFDLRPTASIDIRDQVISTTVMMCLSNAVETAQGNIEKVDYRNFYKKRNYSYGNRLYCKWKYKEGNKEIATYNWGNSEYYRKYYVDYKSFHQRPLEFGEYYDSIASEDNAVYIINLDLKNFYDHIDLGILIRKLKEIYINYKVDKEGLTESEAKFFGKLKEVFSWQWNQQDRKDFEKDIFDSLPKGLPQGLVASGFLSNAYMVDFDNAVGAQINKLIKQDTGRSVILRDYCRYVDDMRLVIEVKKNVNEQEMMETLHKFVDNNLKEYCSEKLELNKEKTEVTAFRTLATSTNISTEMLVLQNMISGTPDDETLEQVTGGLEGMLSISESMSKYEKQLENKLMLSTIRPVYIGVKDDSIKKFAANKLLSSLRMRREFTDLNAAIHVNTPKITKGKILDDEFEYRARELIGYWSRNPSLIYLLKCALRLYPDKDLMESILQALYTKLVFNPDGVEAETMQADERRKRWKEKLVAEYILADLLYTCSSFITYENKDYYPASADIEGLSFALGKYARKVLSEKKHSWYVMQSAILFLLSIEDISFEIKHQDKGKLQSYEMLLDAYRYKRNSSYDALAYLTTGLIVQQLKPNKYLFISWYMDLLENKNENVSEKRLNKLLFEYDASLLHAVFLESRNLSVDDGIKKYLSALDVKESILFKKIEISLIAVLRSKENPFIQENALLVLIQALIRCIRENKLDTFSVLDFSVSSEDWQEIQNPFQSEYLKVTYTANKSASPTLPKWVEADKKELYLIGMIIRSCLVGSYDYTMNDYVSNMEEDRYLGITQTSFTRSFGMRYIEESRLATGHFMTPWLKGLLASLLDVPGTFQKNYIHKPPESLDDLSEQVYQRQEKQKQMYCVNSGIPGYIVSTKNQEDPYDSLRIVMVQTELPRRADFNLNAPDHFSNSYRSKQRSYLASVCKIVLKHLDTHNQVSEKRVDDSNAPLADLIVFPELSVHHDDIGYLIRLSNMTNANIFAGLTHIQRPGTEEVINQGIWIIRNLSATGSGVSVLYQGKEHPTKGELDMGVIGYRPHQVFVEYDVGDNKKVNVTSAICYDSTDLKLINDLKDKSDLFIVSALNQDVDTFDNMVTAMNYHMYQPIVLVNTGEFGGSNAQAPYSGHNKVLAHFHGGDQLGISVVDVNVNDFKDNRHPTKKTKTKPAGL